MFLVPPSHSHRYARQRRRGLSGHVIGPLACGGGGGHHTRRIVAITPQGLGHTHPLPELSPLPYCRLAAISFDAFLTTTSLLNTPAKIAKQVTHTCPIVAFCQIIYQF